MFSRRLTSGEDDGNDPIRTDGENDSALRDMYQATHSLVQFALKNGHSPRTIRSDLTKGLRASAGWFGVYEQETIIATVQRAIEDALELAPPPKKNGSRNRAAKK